MPRKRHKPEEIVAKLRQVDVLVSQGQSVADAVRAVGVTEVTYYRWRQVSIGVETGPTIGVQKGPTRGARHGRRRHAAAAGKRRRPPRLSPAAAGRTGPAQVRVFSRQLALPVSRMSQWCVSRSSRAVVIFASPNTRGHSANGRLVVTITEVRS